MNNTYTFYLPSYSVGPDCYKEVFQVTRRYGKKAVVVGGKTAMEKARAALEAGLLDTELELVGFVWYGGNCTYENVEMLKQNSYVQQADMVFGMGGGRAVDTCKVLCDQLDKPLFTFPTIASNCAASTAISVVYNADDSLNGYYYPKTPPMHCFINTQVIAQAPEKLLWAGIGDALSKEYEVCLATRGKELSHTPLMGVQLSHTCTEPLVRYGAQALADCRAGVAGDALQQVALDIVMSTGYVSNMTTGKDYYYNSSIAHCIYNGSTVVPKAVHEHLHGAIVAFGVLCLLTYDGQLEERDRIMAFNHSIGLPVTLEQVGLTEEDLSALVEKASTVTEWTCTPYPMDKQTLKEKMLECDAAGRAYCMAHEKLA